MTKRPIKIYADTSGDGRVNKSFNCVEIMHKGAEAVHQKIASLLMEQQLEYWRKGGAGTKARTVSPAVFERI